MPGQAIVPAFYNHPNHVSTRTRPPILFRLRLLVLIHSERGGPYVPNCNSTRCEP
jgi:hypothetical protein